MLCSSHLACKLVLYNAHECHQDQVEVRRNFHTHLCVRALVVAHTHDLDEVHTAHAHELHPRRYVCSALRLASTLHTRYTHRAYPRHTHPFVSPPNNLILWSDVTGKAWR
jgi:hypothetical protein